MPKRSAPPDPIAAATAAAAASGSVNRSVFENEPIRTWFFGLCELKAQVGVALRWQEIHRQLHVAAKAARASGEAVVNKKARRLTEDELTAISKYLRSPPSLNTMQQYIGRNYPELAARLRAVASAGRGEAR